MKKLLRMGTALIVRLTRFLACQTYGEIAELSAGPCQRCVGQSVSGAVAERKGER